MKKRWIAWGALLFWGLGMGSPVLANWETLYAHGQHGQAIKALQADWHAAETHRERPEFLADIVSNMATIYHADGLDSWADACYRRAVSLYQSQPLSKAGSVPYALTLNNWGELQATDHPDLAEQHFKQALDLLPPTHVDYTRPLLNLARLYRNQGQYAKAEPLFLQAMSLDAKNHGASSAPVINDAYGLALLYIKQGQAQKALALLNTSEPQSEALFGKFHPNTLQIQDLSRQIKTDWHVSSR